jgi:hypothetical protein
MSDKKGIYWLASYPKSGNTWFRIFLAHLLDPAGKQLHLEEIRTGAIASARGWVDEALGFNSADLDHDELDQLRPAVYEWHAEHLDAVGYHKIHDAYTILPSGMPMIPTKGCLGALYFVRNPLDVAISYANHASCSVNKAIQFMGNPRQAFCKDPTRQYSQLRQHLLSWSLHVQSWCTQKNIPCLVLRYEDMKAHPLTTFTQAVEFLQIETSSDRIQQALADASIERLQQLEKITGFSEKPAKTKYFFRKGIVGDWKNTLTHQQIDQIIQDHSEVMRNYGYL